MSTLGVVPVTVLVDCLWWHAGQPAPYQLWVIIGDENPDFPGAVYSVAYEERADFVADACAEGYWCFHTYRFLIPVAKIPPRSTPYDVEFQITARDGTFLGRAPLLRDDLWIMV